MANHTLLDSVNEILKRVNIVDTANIGILTSLTSSSIQNTIDVAIQVVNEGIDELYTAAEVELPNVGGESTFTLVNGQREYSLASNLTKLLWPAIDRSNIQYLYEWVGDYPSFLAFDPQQVYTGLPIMAMISPITGMLRLDRQPDNTVAGHTYTYEFMKDTALALATDQVPFNNLIFRAMVPAWVQLYNKEKRKEFDQGLYNMSVGRAARMLTEQPMKKHYSPRG